MHVGLAALGAAKLGAEGCGYFWVGLAAGRSPSAPRGASVRGLAEAQRAGAVPRTHGRAARRHPKVRYPLGAPALLAFPL